MDIYLIAEIVGIIFILNANPIFTVPTWLVTVALVGKADPISLIPIIIIAISASTLGRYVLASYSNILSDKILSKRQKRNIQYLKEFFGETESQRNAYLIALLYALSPLPTNALFILAGMAKLRIFAILAGFFTGELISNIVYITVLESVLESVTFSTYEYLFMGIIGLVIAAAVILINWKKLIHELVQKELEKKGYAALREMYK